jgi:hypothetical protein
MIRTREVRMLQGKTLESTRKQASSIRFQTALLKNPEKVGKRKCTSSK